MHRRRLRGYIAAATLVLVTGCRDLLVAPAPQLPPGLALSLVVPAAAAGDPAAAFDRADVAHVRVTGPGVTLERLVEFRADAETRIRVELDAAQDGATYTVQVELRRGSDVLFTGTAPVAVRSAQTTELTLPLTPVAAIIDLPAALPIATVLGDTIRLQAMVRFATGDPLPAARVAWTTSDAAVATVDDGGRVVPRGDGSAIITASSGVASRSVTLTVLETPARVVRVCAAGTGRTYATPAMAVDSVAAGGTIRFCTGTFAAAELTLPKAVVLEAEPGATPVLDAGGARFAVMPRHPAGTVTVRGLTFTGYGVHAINATDSRAAVVVEQSTFVTPTGAQAGLFAAQSDRPDATVHVRASTFRGGEIGVFFAGAVTAHVLDSRFEGQTASNIQYQQGAGGTVLRNVVEECGQAGCIRARFAGDLRVAENVARTTARRGTFPDGVLLGIVLDGQSVLAERNTVEGLGQDRPFRDGALAVLSSGNLAGTATFRENSVRNATWGAAAIVAATGGVSAHLQGADNVFEQVTAAFATRGGTLDLRRNDVSGFTRAFDLQGPPPAPQSLACNWWGGPTAPAAPGVDPAAYLPISDTPIAGTGRPCPQPAVAAVVPAQVTAGDRVVLRITGRHLHGATHVTVCGTATVEPIAGAAADGTSVDVPVRWATTTATGQPQSGDVCVNVHTPGGTATGSVRLQAPAQPPAPALAGLWNMVLVNDRSVPVRFTYPCQSRFDMESYEIHGSSMTFADSTVHVLFSATQTWCDGTVEDDSDDLLWRFTHDGGTVVVFDPDYPDDALRATILGSRLVFDLSGWGEEITSYTYEKASAPGGSVHPESRTAAAAAAAGRMLQRLRPELRARRTTSPGGTTP